jgi:hypothetical protein
VTSRDAQPGDPPGSEVQDAAPASHPWRERLVLSGATSLTAGAVMAWAGTGLALAAIGAATAGVVVLTAAWLASTMPSPTRPRGAHAAPGTDPDGPGNGPG